VKFTYSHGRRDDGLGQFGRVFVEAFGDLLHVLAGDVVSNQDVRVRLIILQRFRENEIRICKPEKDRITGFERYTLRNCLPFSAPKISYRTVQEEIVTAAFAGHNPRHRHVLKFGRILHNHSVKR
jgi:hypothetical protein